MSEYVKLADDPTFWFIEAGKRTIVYNLDEHGLLPIRVVTPDELEEIPFAMAGIGRGLDEEE